MGHFVSIAFHVHINQWLNKVLYLKRQSKSHNCRRRSFSDSKISCDMTWYVFPVASEELEGVSDFLVRRFVIF